MRSAMNTTFAFVAAAATGLMLAGSVLGAGSQQCNLIKIDEWPLRPQQSKPVIDGMINGQKIGVVLDTGMPGVLLERSAALRLGLTRHHGGAAILGVGGESYSEIAHIDEIRIGGAVPKDWRVQTAGEYGSAGGSFLLGFEFF